MIITKEKLLEDKNQILQELTFCESKKNECIGAVRIIDRLLEILDQKEEVENAS